MKCPAVLISLDTCVTKLVVTTIIAPCQYNYSPAVIQHTTPHSTSFNWCNHKPLIFNHLPLLRALYIYLYNPFSLLSPMFLRPILLLYWSSISVWPLQGEQLSSTPLLHSVSLLLSSSAKYVLVTEMRRSAQHQINKTVVYTTSLYMQYIYTGHTTKEQLSKESL